MKSRIAASILGILVAAGSASADFVIGLDTEFSQATPPTSGLSPWMTATFSQINATTVHLRVENIHLVGSEFVTGFYFNVQAPEVSDPRTVQFSSFTNTGTFLSPVVNKKAANPLPDSDFKADGDGYFDFRFDFATGTNGWERFGAGEAVEFDMTLATGLLLSWFVTGSEPGGGHGSWQVAAHVQGIGPNAQNSGWIGGNSGDRPEDPPVIPLPHGAGMATAGLACLFGVGYIRRRR
jgi:hypothetical protein